MEAVMSVICELTMEYGHHATISEDNMTASFIFDALLCADLTCDLTFMDATHYNVEVTMDLESAERPMRDEHIGHYIYLPTNFVMREDGAEGDPYIEMTYVANVRACTAFKLALGKLDKAYVFNVNAPVPRKTQRGRRFAANACEAMGMDTD